MIISNTMVGVISLVLLLALLTLRVHVGIALCLAGFVGIALKTGFGGAAAILSVGPYIKLSEYHWSVMPLFILMGLMGYYSGMSSKLFKSAEMWLGKLPGGLLLATTLSAGAFAAACGSSVASTAVFTKIAFPEMRERGYHRGLSAGCIAASGTMAILIPPSGLLVFYGIFTMQSIGMLLIAGILPGLMELLFYLLMIWGRTLIDPRIAPKLQQSYTWRERWKSLVGVWGFPAIFVVVIGGIFFGVFTATQAGAIGAFASIFVALAYKGLTRETFVRALLETTKTSSVIFLIIFGALVFSRAIALSQIPTMAVNFIQEAGVPSSVVIGSFILMYLILGMFMEGIALLAITLPICFPIIIALGFSPIWFGIVMTNVVEIALITPPVGLTVYVVKAGVGDAVSMNEIFRGIGSFLIMDVIRLGLIIAFPSIVLFLPSIMSAKG